MHRIASTSGDLSSEKSNQLISQTPGELVFLSTADTDLSCVARVWESVFGSRLRISHASPLQNPNTAKHYVNQLMLGSKLVILRLLGGKAYFRSFIEEISNLKSRQRFPKFLFLPSTDTWDPEVMEYNDYAEHLVRKVFSYFQEGGMENMEAASGAILLMLEGKSLGFPLAKKMPRFGWYKTPIQSDKPQVWVCFYRALYQIADLEVVDYLTRTLKKKGFEVASFYSFSLRQPETQDYLLQEVSIFRPKILITLQSFSICIQEENRVSFLETMGIPVFQFPIATMNKEHWNHSPRGLTPSEVAMNIALPEIDGRIFGTVIGFKEEKTRFSNLEFTLKKHKPDPKKIDYCSNLAWNWSQLSIKKNQNKKIAIILANYPTKNSRIGNGVGLDTPASVVAFLNLLKKQGYQMNSIPKDGTELMNLLQSVQTNDKEDSYGKPCFQDYPRSKLENFVEALTDSCQNQLRKPWSEDLPINFPVPGMQIGNVFIGIQPSRGFGEQSLAIYHDPKLSPPPEYLAFYLWLRETFKADAIVHFGKHGNLEWLPGKSLALGESDFPQVCLGPIPHLYPFIVNDPGEGTQAKRRSAAVIVDHLTPPLMRAGLYDDLDKMEKLVEEHAHCETFYPERAHELEHKIEHLLKKSSWKEEIPNEDDFINALTNFLCEIKESQIRSGLHIMGQVPKGQKKIDFLLSLLRLPIGNHPGLLESLAEGKDYQNMTSNEKDALQENANSWIDKALKGEATQIDTTSLAQLYDLFKNELVPKLDLCKDELNILAKGLEGKMICPGPSGAPTRGRLDVLPTGKNFYSIDPRVLPTPSAWNTGKKLADALMQKHLKETGQNLKHLAMLIWGTSNMRTGGDDIAQALWLWGCEPIWEKISGRLIDFKICPAAVLGRPRVDVLLRVSGLFRDAFGDIMQLLATIPKRLAKLDEPQALNPLRAAYEKDKKAIEKSGKPAADAEKLSQLRVFSSGPGCYGTGLLPLIDSGNWETKEDIYNVFMKWGNHAYDSDGSSSEQNNLLKKRLTEVEVVYQNQDNREHDILDSDDYFQFQGGLSAAVEHLRGEAPKVYHGDSSIPDQVKVRTLKEEFNRVFRSRVVNPKWIEAMREHGYKGAFEMAATVDYIFGYDATCDLVSDAQYEDIANHLLLDSSQTQFFKNHNPAALKEAIMRLLEAKERNLWKNAQEATLENLENTLLDIEGKLE